MKNRDIKERLVLPTVGSDFFPITRMLRCDLFQETEIMGTQVVGNTRKCLVQGYRGVMMCECTKPEK